MRPRARSTRSRLRRPALLAVLAIALALPSSDVLSKKKKKQAEALEPALPRWTSVAARDGLAFFGRTDGLVVMDFAKRTSPVEIGRLLVRSTIHDIWLEGNLGYLAAGSRGLIIVDLADPSVPSELARFDTPGSARRVVLRDQVVLIADHQNGLRVLDVSRPRDPRQRATISTRGEMHDLALEGALLATAEGQSGARLIDVSVADTPRPIGTLPHSEGARGVAFVGEWITVAAGRRGLLVYRWDRRGDFELVGQFEAGESAIGVREHGGRAIALYGGSGLRVIGLQNPAAPREQAGILLPRSHPAMGLTLDDDLAFIASDIAGFALVDVSSPIAPEVLIPFDRPMRVRFR